MTQTRGASIRGGAAEHKLQSVPGVGKKIAGDLVLIGIKSIKDLRNKTPKNYMKDYAVNNRTFIFKTNA